MARAGRPGYKRGVRPWIHALCALLALTSLGFEWEGRLARLRRELDDPDPARRREVVQLLSGYPAGEVREALLGALEDPDAAVRAQAADAVGRVRLREALPRLLDWLDDPNADVRAAAARALGQIGAPQAIGSLVRVLGDSHAEVRRAGVAALAAIGSEAVVVPLLGRLDDVDARVRVDAAEALGHLGDPRAAVPLVGRARDDAPEVRAAVYSALGELGAAAAVPALVQGLRDPAPDPQLAAIGALGRIGSAEAVRPLLAELERDDARVGRAVTAALGQIRADAAQRALVRALRVPTTRAMAAQTLLERARRDARAGRDTDGLIDGLAAALRDANDPAHATQLARTLTEIATHASIERAAPALLDALREGRGEPPVVLRALGATGSPDALVPLLERLRSEEAPVQLAVLEALRRYFDRVEPDGRAADPLLASLGEVPAPMRASLVALLGRVGATRSLGDLRALLAHDDGELRLAAIRAIGAIGDPAGASAVLPLLDDRDARLRFEAARAVGAAASDDDALRLVRRVWEREPLDRHSRLTALADALPRLEAAGALSDGTRGAALRMLTQVAETDDEALAARALDALAAWHPPEASAPLRAALERAPPSRAAAIARALGAIDDDEARAALRGLMDRPSVSLRAVTASVLGEHGGPAEAALLLERGPTLPWPASASASFALARLARRGVLQVENAQPGLCALGASHDPFVRANVAIAMAALGAPPCPEGAHPLAWLERHHAGVVRAAAARWARAAADAGHLPSGPVGEALAACAEEPLMPAVADVCARPGLPELGARADVFAYSPDGAALLRQRTVALRLADGTAWVTRTDANGHLRLDDAPRGALALEDPSATPLEP